MQTDVSLSGTATVSITDSSADDTNDVYRFQITPATNGTLDISIAAGVATDAAGNNNTASRVLSGIMDLDAPTVTITTETEHAQISSSFNVIVTFNETARQFYGQDTIEVEPDGGLSFLSMEPPWSYNIDIYGHPKHPDNIKNYYVEVVKYRYTYTGSDSPENITFNIAAEAAKDRAGNLSTAATELVVPIATIDVDNDGDVDIDDVRLVAVALGEAGDSITDTRTDVNKDDTVDGNDVLLVIDNMDDAAAPPSADIFADLSPDALQALDPILLTETLDAVRLESDGSLKYLQAIALLEHILAEMRPDETRLLANYPNPFNPETWMPYHLAKPSDVTITIYDTRGSVIRRLELGHQTPGYYTSRNRAAYWDGRNAVAERVASGIYFYQLQADNMSLLRKMVILK